VVVWEVAAVCPCHVVVWEVAAVCPCGIRRYVYLSYQDACSCTRIELLLHVHAHPH
jgi:hypothetical protein